jgi:hypothetical protein
VPVKIYFQHIVVIWWPLRVAHVPGNGGFRGRR